jgi:hypothetical protein
MIASRPDRFQTRVSGSTIERRRAALEGLVKDATTLYEQAGTVSRDELTKLRMELDATGGRGEQLREAKKREAAELALANGYDTFTLVSRDTDRKTTLRMDPRPTPLPYWNPYWRYYGPYGWRAYDPWMEGPYGRQPLEASTIEKFTASAEIVLGRGPKRADDPEAFDARAVIENLGPRIQRPDDGRVRP